MSDYFLGEIKILPYTFVPRSWAACNGQLMDISQNTSLFSIIANNYGGDGRVTFGMPNLQGRSPVGWGPAPGLSNYHWTSEGGYSQVQLSETHLPTHSHSMHMDDKPGDAQSPTSNTMLARDKGNGDVLISYLKKAATAVIDGQPMAGQAISSSGASEPLSNRQPYLAMPFCICIDGIYPQRS